MEKLDLQTLDFTAANIALLAELFPNCATETRLPDGTLKRAIDFDLLRQELCHDLVEGPQERYRLDWPGKREALALANAPIRKTLRPSREESVNFDTTKNLYIDGDNLDALKLLQETYLGQVKMIYIDPPYNTGNDFIYEDDFAADREEYERGSGKKDEEGRMLIDEERWRQNSAANGRLHSDWLTNIYPRLRVARRLLSDDGVVCVSIDDNEIHNLRKILDEVFGAGCFLAEFVWKCRQFTDARASSNVSTDHEYVVCYSREAGTSFRGRLRDESKYRNPDNDPRGPWMSRSILGLATKDQRPNLHYSITDPSNGNVFSPPENTGWRYNKKRMEDLISERAILFPAAISGRPREKKFRADLANEFTSFPTVIDGIHTSHGTSATRDLFGSQVFDFPKPVELLKAFAEQLLGPTDIGLDIYAGSSSFAHAVMQLNAEDGGNRRHIMVQLPEPCDEKSEAFKAGYATIAEIGKERIRRAGKKIRSDLEEKLAKELPGSDEHASLRARLDSLDTGFRVLKVDSSNMANVYYEPDELKQENLLLHVDNLLPARKPEDLLFQVLLDWGLDLALPVTEEKIAGRRVFFVDDDALAACFETGLDEAFVKALATRAPLRAVFRDAGYASDAVKINIEQIFKALSPHTDLKTL